MLIRLFSRTCNTRQGYNNGVLDVRELVVLLETQHGDELLGQLVDADIVAAALAECPIGTLAHRIWECHSLDEPRRRHVPRELVDRMRVGPFAECTATTRALLPTPLTVVPPPPEAETFEWVLRPADESLTFAGIVYPDGSASDPTCPVLRRLGWAFTVVNAEGIIIAAARGRPPAWIRDVPGAEAWALLQAATRALPGTSFRIDCLHVVRGCSVENNGPPQRAACWQGYLAC